MALRSSGSVRGPNLVKTIVANQRGVHAGVHARRRYTSAMGRGSRPPATPRLPDPAEGVFAAIEVVLRRADEGCKPGQSRGLCSREGRFFRTYTRDAMELFCRAANSHSRQGKRVSRRLNLNFVNRPPPCAGKSGSGHRQRQSRSPQGESGASQWKQETTPGSRHNCSRRKYESARPVCATVTPRRPSFRSAIGRTSYLTAASYRSATYSQFTRLSTKALR
jgi:hypothetical protein